MDFLIFLIVVAALTVLPIKIAAGMLGAENTGFLTCFIAVIGAAVAETLATTYITNELLSGIATIAFTAVCFSLILGAKYVQSIFIALLTYIVQIVIALLLAGIGFMAVTPSSYT